MATPKWIRKNLQARGIRFEELHHEEALTAQELAHQEHVSGHFVAKVVVVMADNRPIELVLPATRYVEMDRLPTILKAQEVRLATEKELEKFFDEIEVGAVPPLRHWKNVDVIMDPALKAAGPIVFMAGTHRDAIRLSFQDWYDVVKPRVARFSRPAETALA